jgi:hypothetical protein
MQEAQRQEEDGRQAHSADDVLDRLGEEGSERVVAGTIILPSVQEPDQAT